MVSTSCSFPSIGVLQTSGYLQTEQQMLKQDQIAAIVSELKALDGRVVLEAVKSEVGNGHHLVYFPERKEVWDYFREEPVLQEFVIALLATYICLFSDCCKGRAKYAKPFQVEWMVFLRKVFHENHKLLEPDSCESHPVAILWNKLTTSGPVNVAVKNKNAIGMSVARSVFNYCQKRVVSVKEGNTLLCDWEQSSLDHLQETGVDIDEAALFRLGGYALHSTIKEYEKREKRGEELAVLCAIRMPFGEKHELPGNIKYLDKGCMTFMRRELLGYLAKVNSLMQEYTSTEYARAHGQNIMKLIEDKVTLDGDLLRTFIFSCSEVGVPSCRAAVLPKLHLTLVKKMVHTHCNEVLENRRLLSSVDAGVILEVPLMLRDQLNVMAADKNKVHS